MAEDPLKIDIQLIGHFRLLGPDEKDITPNSQKAQALVALLASGSGMRRSRSWLQDKLWSDRAPSKGSASLRQTLTKIRRSLGEYADIIQASRLDVWLDETRVTMDWEPEASSAGAQFLEGIDIRDPEFEDWLRVMRGAAPTSLHMDRSPYLKRPREWDRVKVVIESSEDAVSAAFHLECEFVDLLTKNLAENTDFEVAFERGNGSGARMFVIQVKAFGIEDHRIGLRVTAQHVEHNRIFWSETATSIEAPSTVRESFDLMNMAFRLQIALSHELRTARVGQAQGDPQSMVVSNAIPKIFSFKPEELQHASKALDDVLDEKNAATIWGWQAQIAVINLIERFSDAPEDCIERGKLLAAKSVEADPMNSMVLATASNTQMLLDWDLSASAELADLAIRVNSSNPLGWWAYANVALYLDDADKALKAAKVASKLSARTPMQFWCDCLVGLAALRANDCETACKIDPH